MRGRLSTAYYNLKYLSVDIDFRYYQELLATLSICKTSPNLQELKIRSQDFPLGDTQLRYSFIMFDNIVNGWLWDGENVDYLLKHLKFVELPLIHGNEVEIAFIRYLLILFPVLLVMSIKINTKMESEKSMIFENLMGCYRA